MRPLLNYFGHLFVYVSGMYFKNLFVFANRICLYVWLQSTCRGLVGSISGDLERTELKELVREMSLAANVTNSCRRHMTSLYAEVMSCDVDENRRTSENYRPCRLSEYRARVAAYSAAYWHRVDAAVRPLMIAHRRYVDRVGTTPTAVHRDVGSRAHRAAAWFHFPRGLFNVSRRRLPWTSSKLQRRQRKKEGRSGTSSDNYDDTLVDFLMFLDVSDVEEAMMWQTRLRQRSVVVDSGQSNLAKAASNPSHLDMGGSGSLSNTMFLGPPRVFTPNETSIRSAVFVH